MLKNFWQKNQEALKFIGLIFAVWQFCLIILASASLKFLPVRDHTYIFPGSPLILAVRANFDGIHYLRISSGGYSLHQQAFFPLYPTLINLLRSGLHINHLFSGIIISNVSLLIFLFFFYKLIELDWDGSTARTTLIFFLAFPASFFLGMVYSESLFLVLAVTSFYCARKGRWLLAGILGGLASYTRILGVFLLPALVIEWAKQGHLKNLKSKFKSLAFLSLVPCGLFYYMAFLWRKYKDPLMFVHVQPYFGAGRSGGKIILLYQVFWRYIRMALTTKFDPLYFTVWLEFLSAVFFLLFIFLSFKKKIRLSYLIFAVAAYVLPTLSGTLSSFPRYALPLFPCFILLGTIKNKLAKTALAIIFSILSAISAAFFFRGYWIS